MSDTEIKSKFVQLLYMALSCLWVNFGRRTYIEHIHVCTWVRASQELETLLDYFFFKFKTCLLK